MAKRVRIKESDNEDRTIESLRKLLEIDKYEIDEEIVRQPQLFFEIGEAAVKAAAERDFAKDELKRIDAELYGTLRRKLEKGSGKATEGQVTNAVLTDKQHIRAVKRYIRANEKSDLLQALKEAFNQRSYMLRDLASLYVANYYEKSSMTSETDVRDVKAKKNIDRMAKARKADRNKKRKRD